MGNHKEFDKNDDAGEYDEDLTNIDVIDVSDEATLFVKIELLFVNAEFVLEDWLFVWWVVWVDEDEIVEEVYYDISYYWLIKNFLKKWRNVSIYLFK